MNKRLAKYCILAFLLLNGCMIYYVPVSVDIPLIDEEDDTKIETGMS